MPKGDSTKRPPIIPQSVIRKVERPEEMKTARDLQEELGGAGVWSFPYQEHYILEDPDWKYDKPPEFFHGKNVADFYDPDIEEKLNELEKEEEYLAQLDAEEIVAEDSDEARLMKEYESVQ